MKFSEAKLANKILDDLLDLLHSDIEEDFDNSHALAVGHAVPLSYIRAKGLLDEQASPVIISVAEISVGLAAKKRRGLN
jgi:hypothetical protein